MAQCSTIELHAPDREGYSSPQGKLKPSKVFPDAVERADTGSPGLAGDSVRLNQITSLSFDDSGERCLIAGEDHAFTLWDMRKGK